MVYLNNAATTYPKPPAVLQAWREALESPPANAFRSTAVSSSAGEGGDDVMATCRQQLGRLLGIARTDRIHFTSGATESINRLLLGLEGIDSLPVVATQTEHNSVLRPLYNLPHLQRPPHIVPCDSTGRLLIDDLEQCLDRIGRSYPEHDTAPHAPSCLLIVNHCSNVTGVIQDIPTIARLAHRYGALLLLDAAQSAGCLPIHCDRWGIDLLAFTGHKGLIGPPGTGGYYVRPGITLRPTFYGGTGRDSSRLIYPGSHPYGYEYEVGTPNLPGIAALSAGAQYVLDRGIDHIMAHERQLIQTLRQGLDDLPRVKIYASDDEQRQGPVLSLRLEGMTPYDLGFVLHNVYGIAVRTGLHCSPLIHQAMGTASKGAVVESTVAGGAAEGTVRVSVQDLTTMADINTFLQAMREIVSDMTS